MPPKSEEISDRPEMVDILVTRASIFWLPSKAERDPKTGKKLRPVCGKLMLRPGANRIRRKRWEMTADHPTIQAHIRAGTLKVDPDAEEVRDHTHTPDPVRGLEDLTVAKAAPWIEAATDVNLLSKWRTAEVKGKNRRGVLEAIDTRTEALENEAAGGGD
jgi:hypothetical protein